MIRALASNVHAVAPVVSEASPMSNRQTLGAAPEAYAVKDLAGMLQCSGRHIWRMAELGAIPGKFRFGRLVRFSRAAVDAWLAQATTDLPNTEARRRGGPFVELLRSTPNRRLHGEGRCSMRWRRLLLRPIQHSRDG
jgi:excisionase family DNA binding protein